MYEWIKNHHKALAPFTQFKAKAVVPVEKLFKNREGALYIHIPFCIGNCKFCVLYKERPNTTTTYEKFVGRVIDELEHFKTFNVDILYFGGGTPTLLPTDQFERILSFVYGKNNPKEITVESTITEFNKEKAEDLSSLGVNRISFGVQSFSNKMRSILGRRSREKEVIEKLDLAKKYFDVVSIDLLYDLPFENVLMDDVRKAVEIGINGISIYPLEYNKVMSRYPHPDVKRNEENFLEVYDYLISCGYKHLSINHFADNKDKFCYSECFTHIEKPLLGIGPGAGGHINEYEMFYVPSVSNYLRNSHYGIVSSSIPKEILLGEKIISKVFTGRIDTKDSDVNINIFSSLWNALDKQWIMWENKSIVLLPKGLFWANTLAYSMACDYINYIKNKRKKMTVALG